jgi:hypothetical protein
MSYSLCVTVRWLPFCHVAVDALVANEPGWTVAETTLTAPDGIKAHVYASGTVLISKVPSEQRLGEILTVLDTYRGAPTRACPDQGNVCLSTVRAIYNCHHEIELDAIDPNAFTSVSGNVYRTENAVYRIGSNGLIRIVIKGKELENPNQAFLQAKAFIDPLIN